ncbi:MAG: 5-(carboxyamino)imidazole ribonucleotide synthase [Gaiellales bacterium]
MTLVACIGGGQLGRMLGLAAHRLGVSMRFLDPSPEACAGAVGELVVGDYGDADALARLVAGATAVTYEFENVSADAVARLGALPGAGALREGQDRLREKELFRRLGIRTARFGSLEDTGLPALVKTRRLGYDGKGQRRLDVASLLTADELAEELISFERELSLVAVRGGDGETRFWPLTENVHRDGILHSSRVPAAGAPQADAERIAMALLDALDYVGVLAVELFERGGELLANEFAPRVHNTGHWTIDGAVTSQFENHVRAVLGLPLGSTELVAPCTMMNLVGETPPLGELLAIPGARVHLYGKTPRPGRKLGHVTLVDADTEADHAVRQLVDAAWC